MGNAGTRGSDNGTSRGNGRNKGADSEAGKQAQESALAGTEAVGGTGALTGAGAGTGVPTGVGAPVAPEKRTDDNAAIDPTSLAPDEYERDDDGNVILTIAGKPRKKRGRKKGQTAGTSSSAGNSSREHKGNKTAIAVEMLAAQFQILNTGIAYLTSFEDFKLEGYEAMQMALATANVFEQFDYVPDPKVAAILGLVTTTSMIYGPRMYLYRKHLQKKRSENRARREAQADESFINEASPFPYPQHLGPNKAGQFG